MKRPYSKLLLSTLVMTMMSPVTYGIDLTGAFIVAQSVDPQYQAAKSANVASNAQALNSRLAYLPTYNYSRAQLPTLGATSFTQGLSQPIFDMGKATTFLQGGPQSTLAAATFTTSTQDLATRTLNAVNQIVLAKEALKANKGQIDALEFQYKGATKRYEVGLGTVTDMLDVQVKFEQAKANQLTLKANLQGANDQFAALTGQYPDTSDFILPNKHEVFEVDSLDAILNKVEQENSAIIAAKANEK